MGNTQLADAHASQSTLAIETPPRGSSCDEGPPLKSRVASGGGEALAADATAPAIPVVARRPQVRFLKLDDLPELQRLESEKWDSEQAASAQDMALRVELYPGLSLAAFCPSSGRMLASLFMRPVANDFWKHTKHWRDCVDTSIPLQTSALFGISLSSTDPAAVDAILEFFWPHALAGGWRHIYLGSPVPGWSAWRQNHPGRSVLEYVRASRRGLPLDPQLRYYHGRGFKKIVCLKRDYFPHERSHDHGVIVRGTVPLSSLSMVWRGFKPEQVQRVTRPLCSVML